MRRLLVLLLALLLTACQQPAPPATPQASGVSATESRPLFQGSFIAPASFQAQAVASNLASGATISLIDLATGQVKGTGISDGAGNFTVTALATFTPTLNTLYVLEATKALGTTSSRALSLRTLVSLSPTGWTSISGGLVTISTATTAVALLHRHRGLSSAEVLAKVSYDTTLRRSAMSALNATYTEDVVRQVDAQVQRALELNLDPLQTVLPAMDGTFTVSLATASVNMLVNPGFEAGAAGLDFWSSGGNNSPSIVGVPDTATAVGNGRSCKITVSAAGDTWFGQGWSAAPAKRRELILREGQTYTLSLYAKGAVGGEKLGLRISGETPGFLELGPAAVTLTTSFQRYSYTFVAPRTTSAAVAFIRAGTQAGDNTFPLSFWIDAVQLEAGAYATPYSNEAGSLVYDSTVMPASGVGHTFGPGRNGGSGLVVDSGLNLVANGHAQNGTTGYSAPNGGSLALSTAFGAPQHAPSNTVIAYTHDAGTGWGNAGCAVTVKPNTLYTMSAWLYFPSSSNPAGLTNNFLVSRSADGNSNAIASNAAPITRDAWFRQSVSFNSGPSTTLYLWPIDHTAANSVAAFTMLQVEEGTQVHAYFGAPGIDRYAISPRFVPRNAGTLEYWFSPHFDSSDNRFDNININNPMALMGINDRFDNTIFYLAKSGNTLIYAVDDGPTWKSANWTPTTPLWTAGSWHHVAMTWGAPGTMALYFDGQLVATHPYAGGIFNTAGFDAYPLINLYFSGITNNITYVHNATLDQLRIYDYPRSPQEISRAYLGIEPLVGARSSR